MSGQSTMGTTVESQKPAVAAWRKRAGVVVAALISMYALAVVLICGWMYWQGDRHWTATLILYGPRWLCGHPLPFLAVAAVFFARRWLWILALTALVFLVPLMGFRFNLAPFREQRANLRVMTCNSESESSAEFREPLAALIRSELPDVVAVQEANRRQMVGLDPTWNVVHDSEYIVASRWPITGGECIYRLHQGMRKAAIRFTVHHPDRDLHVFVLHLVTPRLGLQAVFDGASIDRAGVPQLEDWLAYREQECHLVSEWIAGYSGPKIVLGDFNLPVESVLYREYFSFLGNAFSKTGFGFGYTKQTEYFGLDYGTRIDHVLYSAELTPVRAWVAGDVDSDHLPLIADFD